MIARCGSLQSRDSAFGDQAEEGPAGSNNHNRSVATCDASVLIALNDVEVDFGAGNSLLIWAKSAQPPGQVEADPRSLHH